jgi:hypothetical protein
MKAYYLGVESSEIYCDAADSLSFCQITDRGTGAHELTNADRVKLGFMRVFNPPYGTILIIMGRFTDEEMVEVENLGRYDCEALSEEVANCAAGIAKAMLDQGAGIEHHHLLSKADATPV